MPQKETSLIADEFSEEHLLVEETAIPAGIEI